MKRLLWLVAPLRLRRSQLPEFPGYWELPGAYAGRPMLGRKRVNLIRDWWGSRPSRMAY